MFNLCCFLAFFVFCDVSFALPQLSSSSLKIEFIMYAKKIFFGLEAKLFTNRALTALLKSLWFRDAIGSEVKC